MKSSSDFQTTQSIINSSIQIAKDKIILSYLHSTQETFCLVQKRDDFGDILLYRIENHTIRPYHTVHPKKTDTDFRQRLFGVSDSSLYEIKMKVHNFSDQNQIIDFVKLSKKDPKKNTSNLCESITPKFIEDEKGASLILLKLPKWKILGFKEDSDDAFDARINLIGKKTQKLDQNIENIDSTLENAGIKDIVKINQAIEDLEQKSPNFGMYYKVFYWTLNSYIYCFKNSIAGIDQVNSRFDQEYGWIEEGVKKVGNFVLKLGEGIPVVGNFVTYLNGIVDYLADTFYEHKFESKKNSITNIIKTRLKSEDEMIRVIQKTTIAIMTAKQAMIRNPSVQNQVSLIEEFFSVLEKEKKSIKRSLIEEEVVPYAEEDVVGEMAIKDVSLVLNFMFKNSRKIQDDKSKQLHEQIAQGFQQQEKLLAQRLLAQKNANCFGSCCLLY